MREFWVDVIKNSMGEAAFLGLSPLFGFLYLRAKKAFKTVGRGVITPSPDGSKVAIESDGDIWVTGRVGFINLTNSPGKEFGSRWAPNGKWLAFNTNKDGTWTVYTVDVETQRSIVLVKLQTVRAPIGWSDSNDLLIGMGGSIMLIKHTEIEKRLK